MNQFFFKMKEFFLKYEHKIVLFVAFCLIGAISYEFGVMQGQKWQQKPLIIEKPANTPAQAQTELNEASTSQGNALTLISAAKAGAPAIASNCAYVGSKSSNKFYLPTCSYAKRVKPENLVCFKTAEEATGQGRTESKCK